jgi:hypothetical protein
MTFPIFNDIALFLSGGFAGGVLVALIRSRDKRLDEYREQAERYHDLWQAEITQRLEASEFRRSLTEQIRTLAVKAGIIAEPAKAKNKLDDALRSAGYTICNYDKDTGQWSYRRIHLNPQDTDNAETEKRA